MASKRPAVSRSVSAYRAADTRKERKESVTCNISPEMLPLWERTRALFHGTPHHRWEQFTEYVEAHPGEVDAACQSAADAWLDRWLGTVPDVDTPEVPDSAAWVDEWDDYLAMPIPATHCPVGRVPLHHVGASTMISLRAAYRLARTLDAA